MQNGLEALNRRLKRYESLQPKDFSTQITDSATQLENDAESYGVDQASEKLNSLLAQWDKRDASFKAFREAKPQNSNIQEQNRYKEDVFPGSIEQPNYGNQINQEPRSRQADPFTKGFMGTIVPGGQALAQAYSKPIQYSSPPAETSTGSELGDMALETVGSLAGALPTFMGAGSFVGGTKLVQSIKNPLAQKILAGTLTFPLANAPRNLAEVGTGQKSIGKGLLTTAEEGAFGALFGMLPSGKLLDKNSTYITKNILGTVGAGGLGYGMAKMEGSKDQDAFVNAGILMVMHASGAIKPKSKLYDETFDPALNQNVAKWVSTIDKKVLNSLRPSKGKESNFFNEGKAMELTIDKSTIKDLPTLEKKIDIDSPPKPTKSIKDVAKEQVVSEKTIEGEVTQQLYDILPKEQQRFADKIKDTKKRSKFIKDQAVKEVGGWDIIERQKAKEKLADPNATLEERVAARGNIENGTPYNAAEISDIQKAIANPTYLSDRTRKIYNEELAKDQVAKKEAIEEYNRNLPKGVKEKPVPEMVDELIIDQMPKTKAEAQRVQNLAGAQAIKTPDGKIYVQKDVNHKAVLRKIADEVGKDQVNRWALEDKLSIGFIGEGGEFTLKNTPPKIVKEAKLKPIKQVSENPRKTTSTKSNKSETPQKKVTELKSDIKASNKSEMPDKEVFGQNDLSKVGKIKEQVVSEKKVEKYYHGTDKVFNEFDDAKLGQTGEIFGKAHHFSNDKSRAKQYGKNVVEVDADIKSNINLDKVTPKDVDRITKAIVELRYSKGKPKLTDKQLGDIKSDLIARSQQMHGERFGITLADYGDITSILKTAGYKGVSIPSVNEFSVFSSKDIKIKPKQPTIKESKTVGKTKEIDNLPVEDQITKVPRSEIPEPISKGILEEAQQMKAELKGGKVTKGKSFFNEDLNINGKYTINELPDWFRGIEGDKKAILNALDKIIKDKGLDKGVMVERVKSKILEHLVEGKEDAILLNNKGKQTREVLGKNEPHPEISEFFKEFIDKDVPMKDLAKKWEEFDSATKFEFGENKKSEPLGIERTGAGDQITFGKTTALQPKNVKFDKGEKGSPLFDQPKTDPNQISFGAGIGLTEFKQLSPKEIAKTFRENKQALKDVSKIGFEYIKQGAKSFKDWSKKMIDTFSDKIKPHLFKIWDEIKKLATGQKSILNPNSMGMLGAGEFSSMKGKKLEATNPLVKRLNKISTEVESKLPDKPTKVTTSDKKILEDKLKNLKRGHKMGVLDKEDIQKAVHDYAKNLPVDELRKSQIRPLLNEMRKARTPENIEAIVDRIDKIADVVGRSKAYNSIVGKVTKAKSKVKDGKLRGKIDAEEQGIVNDISKAIKLKKSEADLVVGGLETKLENASPEQMERLIGKISIYDQFSNLKGKTITELNKIDAAVDYLIQSGRGKLKEKKAERKIKFDAIREHTVNSVGKAKSQFDKTTFFGELSKKVNTHKINKSWEHIVETLSPKGKGEKAYQGKLHDELTKPVNDATWNENISRQEIITSAEKQIEKLYGGKKKWREAEKTKDTGIKLDGKPLELSQGEAGNLWALWQDGNNKPILEKMGFTDKSINQLYDKFITPETKQLVDWVRNEYKRLHPEYDKVYREIYNAPLGYSDTYVPRSRDLFKGKDVDVLDKLGEHGSVANQHIFRRINSSADFKIKGQDIYSNYIKYITEMEHFKHWSPVVRDLKSVFNANDVRASIDSKYGKNMLGAIDNFIDRFAKGGTSKGADWEIFNVMRRQYNRAVLNLNPVLVPKQLSSTIGYASDIPVASFTKGMAEFWLNPVGNTKILMSHPLMKSRYKLGFTRDMIDILNKSQSRMLKGHKSLMNQMMIFTKLGDAGAIIQGGYPVYKYHYNKSIKSGMSKVKAQEKGLYEFAKATDRMQQAGNIKDLSMFESSGSVAKLFTMYKKSPFQYFNASETAFRNLARGRGSKTDAMKKLFISHFALPMVFQWVSDGFEIDKENQLRAAVLGSFNGLAITGGILNAMWTSASAEGNAYRKLWAFGEQVPVAGMAIKGGDAIYEATKMFGEELGSDDFWKYAHNVAKDVSYWAGLPYIPVSRQYQNTKKIVEGDAEHPIRMGMGYSENGLNKEQSSSSGSRTSRKSRSTTQRTSR